MMFLLQNIGCDSPPNPAEPGVPVSFAGGFL